MKPASALEFRVIQLHRIEDHQHRTISGMQVADPGDGFVFEEAQQFQHAVMCREIGLFAQIDHERLVACILEFRGWPDNAEYTCTMEPMKARVYVTFKKTVLDPQGQTIRSALAGLGHAGITEVRQGKFFEISLDPTANRERAQAEIEQIAHDVLSNPVIEDYRVELID